MKLVSDQNIVCGIDGCGPSDHTVSASESRRRARPHHHLSIVSDVICPWCYVAKRHLEQAFALTSSADAFSVTWYPYELNPSMPKDGMDRRSYRSRKFGSWEYSQQLDAQVASAGKSAGLEFRHDLILRTPNTFAAHRLIWFAGQHHLQDAIVEALFRAYFTEGRDVGDITALIDIAASVGIDRAMASAFLRSDADIEEVRQEENNALHHGIEGVPMFILDGQPIFSGARKPEAIAAYLNAATDAHAK